MSKSEFVSASIYVAVSMLHSIKANANLLHSADFTFMVLTQKPMNTTAYFIFAEHI